MGARPPGAQLAGMIGLAHEVDFFDLYAQDMPAWMLRMDVSPMSVMVAFSHQVQPWGLVEDVGGASRPGMIEASIMPHEAYGGAMTAADIGQYAQIARRSQLPVVVPTQRAIRPAEVAPLHDAGAAALLIGAVVTGTEAVSYARATASYRAAIDGLN